MIMLQLLDLFILFTSGLVAGGVGYTLHEKTRVSKNLCYLVPAILPAVAASVIFVDYGIAGRLFLLVTTWAGWGAGDGLAFEIWREIYTQRLRNFRNQ